MKQPTIYILTNTYNTVLYVGVTSKLIQRIHQYKEKLIKGFSNKYKATKLVWFEQFDNMESAISRKKKLKKWQRK